MVVTGPPFLQRRAPGPSVAVSSQVLKRLVIKLQDQQTEADATKASATRMVQEVRAAIGVRVGLTSSMSNTMMTHR